MTVVQRAVPSHRAPFFRHLSRELGARGAELVVTRGARGAPLGGPLVRGSDALIMEHALSGAELYPALLRSGLGQGPPLALWGAGEPRAYRPAPLARAARARLALLGHRYFAHTEGGRRDALRWGVPDHRITVLRNTTDTAPLRTARDAVRAEDMRELRARHGLKPGRTALFTGRLDAAGRIPYLLAATHALAKLLPGFTLLVAGEGELRGLVEAAAAGPGPGPRRGGDGRSPVVALAPPTPRELATYGATADVLLSPGRVGLTAVDSFVLGLPIVTTPWPLHGAEFEYLEDGRNAVVVRGGPDAYAQAVAALLAAPARLAMLRTACRAEAASYTVEGMSRRFADGVEHLLGT
ncbi:glycosyltransferase [Streptomyces sp. NPDC048172]|uniref:glycosyltransferase n=1 Tax=Streptomyces sp. NPDC048172 TaxID=3365505 RepID=UPI0037122213